MRMCDWSSDVCSSDLRWRRRYCAIVRAEGEALRTRRPAPAAPPHTLAAPWGRRGWRARASRVRWGRFPAEAVRTPPLPGPLRPHGGGEGESRRTTFAALVTASGEKRAKTDSGDRKRVV